MRLEKAILKTFAVPPYETKSAKEMDSDRLGDSVGASAVSAALNIGPLGVGWPLLLAVTLFYAIPP